MRVSKRESGWQAKDGGSVKVSAVSRGVVTGLALVLVGAIVFGLLTLNVLAVEKNLTTIASVWAGVSLVIAAITGGRRAGVRGWLNGGLVGLMLVVVLMGVALVIDRGGISWLTVARNVGVGVVVGAVGGTIGVNLG